MAKSLGKYLGNEIVFDGWHVRDPQCSALRDGMEQARFGRPIGRLEAEALYCAAEAYVHLTTHPAPTRMLTEKLQRIRATVQKNKRGKNVR